MIARSARDLPPNMPSPPSYRKVNPANNSILLLALTSPTLPLSTVDEFAQTILAQRISMVNGVAQVDVIGSQKYAVGFSWILISWRPARSASMMWSPQCCAAMSTCPWEL